MRRISWPQRIMIICGPQNGLLFYIGPKDRQTDRHGRNSIRDKGIHPQIFGWGQRRLCSPKWGNGDLELLRAAPF